MWVYGMSQNCVYLSNFSQTLIVVWGNAGSQFISVRLSFQPYNM